MLDLVHKFLSAIEWLLIRVAILLLGINLFSVMIQIIMRYVFNNPTAWSDPVASDSLAWMTLLGATAAIRKDQNLRIRFFRDKLSKAGRKFLEILCNFITLFFSIALLISGLQLMKATEGTQVAGIPIPLSFADLYSVTVVSAVVMVFFTVEHILKIWRRDRP